MFPRHAMYSLLFLHQEYDEKSRISSYIQMKHKGIHFLTLHILPQEKDYWDVQAPLSILIEQKYLLRSQSKIWGTVLK